MTSAYLIDCKSTKKVVNGGFYPFLFYGWPTIALYIAVVYRIVIGHATVFCYEPLWTCTVICSFVSLPQNYRNFFATQEVIKFKTNKKGDNYEKTIIRFSVNAHCGN